MSGNYSKETRERAVRLVREHSGDYASEWAAISAIASRLGIGSAETLRKWVRQSEVDRGRRRGEHAGVEGAAVSSPQGKRAGADHRDPEGRDKFFRPGARPAATALICKFIGAARQRFGVVPICRALTAHGMKITPRTYWARRSRPPSARALRDQVVSGLLASSPAHEPARCPAITADPAKEIKSLQSRHTILLFTQSQVCIKPGEFHAASLPGRFG